MKGKKKKATKGKEGDAAPAAEPAAAPAPEPPPPQPPAPAAGSEPVAEAEPEPPRAAQPAPKLRAVVVDCDTSEDTPFNADPMEGKISIAEYNSYKSTCDRLIKELQDRLSHEEEAASNLNQNKKKLEGDIAQMKKEIEDLELGLQKVRSKLLTDQ